MNLSRLALALLMGFSTGSVSTYFHQKNQYTQQLLVDRKAFLECQLAWERYYSITNRANPGVHPVDPNQSFWQVIKNEALRMAQTKVQDLVINEPFTLEQQKYLVYHYEVLPKCSKLKDWKKQMNSLGKEN